MDAVAACGEGSYCEEQCCCGVLIWILQSCIMKMLQSHVYNIGKISQIGCLQDFDE